MPAVDAQVSGSQDDGLQNGSSMNLSSTTPWCRTSNSQWLGARVQLTGPESGDTITAAYVEFAINNGGRDDAYGNLMFEAADDAAAFGSGANDFSGRAKTSAVAWAESDTGPNANDWATSPSLVAALQEVIDRPGWSSGNFIAFFFNATDAGGTCNFQVWNYDGSPTLAPRIHVEWTAGGGGGATYTLVAEDGAYALAGNDTGLLASRLLPAEPGSYAVPGNDADLLAARLLQTDAGSYILTGGDAALLVSRLLSAEAGAYTVTGNDAGLLASRLLSAEQGTYSLTGSDAALLAGRLLEAAAGSYTLTGNDVTLIYIPLGGPTYTLVAGPGSYSLTGNDAALLASRLLTAEAGAYVLSGQDAALLAGRRLAAEGGAYTLTGNDAALIAARVLAAEPGAYALVGNAATLVYSGAEIPVTPDSRVFVVAAESRIYVIVLDDRTLVVPAESRTHAIRS